MRNLSFRIFTAVMAVIIIICLIPLPVSAAESDSGAGIVSVSYGNLYVRASATTSAAVLTKLPKGSYVTLISKSGSWWKVEYGKGRYGYCSAAYIKQVTGTYSANATGYLNVRTGPGTSYGVAGWLSPNEYVVVLSSSGKWKQVLYGGNKVGYASGSYLKSGSEYPSISLSVPDYKQSDSRWAYTTVGSSGKTIGTIGCSTTALAMIESYRTGTVIYPDAMSYKLSYTSGGAVYWPGHYTAYFNSDYLSVIYNSLKSGEPVLVGAKNYYGGQHWVVVTGFSGADLKASGFTINDPGSTSKTNLQQLFDSYPYFYKIMYY